MCVYIYIYIYICVYINPADLGPTVSAQAKEETRKKNRAPSFLHTVLFTLFHSQLKQLKTTQRLTSGQKSLPELKKNEKKNCNNPTLYFRFTPFRSHLSVHTLPFTAGVIVHTRFICHRDPSTDALGAGPRVALGCVHRLFIIQMGHEHTRTGN